MWRPGFDFLERRNARLVGAHRALCVYSFVHRGTPEKPGVVFGLDRGGNCRGIAYRVASARRSETIEYLRGREQVTSGLSRGLAEGLARRRSGRKCACALLCRRSRPSPIRRTADARATTALRPTGSWPLRAVPRLCVGGCERTANARNSRRRFACAGRAAQRHSRIGCWLSITGRTLPGPPQSVVPSLSRCRFEAGRRIPLC